MDFGFSAYGLGLLAGLLSTLSPCVLPIVPILLGAAANAHPRAPLALATGLALSYALIGTTLAWAGTALGLDADLLRNAGVTVEERTVRPAELEDADELFTTGNAGKVQPVNKYESRVLQPGPIARQAHELYIAFARTQRVI